MKSSWRRLALPTLILTLVALVAVLAWTPGIELSRAADWMRSDNANVSAPVADTDNTPESKPDPSAEAETPDAPAGAPGDGAKQEKAAEDDTQLHNDTAIASAQADEDNASDDTHKHVVKPEDAAAQDIAGGIPEADADINQMLRLWGVFGSQLRTGCSALRVGDLRCLSDRGSFAMVKRYNRPALLRIQVDGQRRIVLLSELNNGQATLVGADGTRRVPVDQLARLWTGQFEMIWRVESGLGLIQPGAVGNAVVWLRKRLARAEGRNPETDLGPPSPVYDDALEQQVKQFQLNHGLEADGMAGPRTQIMLNGAVAAPGSPSLTPAKG